ncbi:hypothetical protein FQR65_LT15919 [Abscondita terminalis]|nr:hypothetical protein FQR65_LT15919 [Abscondita terminalis]
MIILLLAPLLLMACQSGTTSNKSHPEDSASSLKDSLEAYSAETSGTDSSSSVVTAYLDLGKSLYIQDQDKIMKAANFFAQILKIQHPDQTNVNSREDIKDILENTTENIQHILDSKDNLIHQREHYEIISQDIYDYIKLVGIQHTLYKFECKLSSKPQTWLSDTKEESGAQQVKRYDLYVRDTIVNYAGKNKRAIAVNGQIPMPTLEFTQVITAEIVVHNELKENTSLHWHGLFLPNKEDGVPYLTQPQIAPGTTFTYQVSDYSKRDTLVSFPYGTPGADRKGIDDLPAVPLILSEWTNLNPDNVHRMLHNANDWAAIKKGATQSYAEAVKEGKLKIKLKNEWKRNAGVDVMNVIHDKILMNGNPFTDLKSVDGKPLKAGDKVRLRISNGEDRTNSSSYFIGSGVKQLLSPLPRLKYFEGMKMMNDMMKMNGDLDDMGMQMSLNKMDMNVVMYPEITGKTDKIPVKKGEILRITRLYNNSMMRHPMHLHGFDFRVINGKGDKSPLKNVLDIMPMETDTIEFLANEEGDWFFHVILYNHMMSGRTGYLKWVIIKNPILLIRPELTGCCKKKVICGTLWRRMILPPNGNTPGRCCRMQDGVSERNGRLGYNDMHGYEVETHVGRYLGKMQWLMPFVGFDWRYRKMGKDEHEKEYNFGQEPIRKTIEVQSV